MKRPTSKVADNERVRRQSADKSNSGQTTTGRKRAGFNKKARKMYTEENVAKHFFHGDEDEEDDQSQSEASVRGGIVGKI